MKRRSANDTDACSVCGKKVGAGTLSCGGKWYCMPDYPKIDERLRLEVEHALEHNDLESLRTAEILLCARRDGEDVARTVRGNAPLTVTMTRERWTEIRRAVSIVRGLCENLGPTTKKRHDDLQWIEMELVSQEVRS